MASLLKRNCSITLKLPRSRHFLQLQSLDPTGSEEESEGNCEHDNTAAVVNHDRRFSCVSESEIFPLATTKLELLDSKCACKARINLVRKQQIASYLLFDAKNVSRKTLTPSRVRFGVSNLVARHATKLF